MVRLLYKNSNRSEQRHRSQSWLTSHPKSVLSSSKPCNCLPSPQGGTQIHMQNQKYPQQTASKSDRPLILPLTNTDASQLPLVGGKGANLGELLRAGLPVPEGFCVTTAAYELASQQANLEPMLDALAATEAGDSACLERYAAEIRDALLKVPMPPAIADAIREAYREPVAVAVRSSATAEDLPFASFAGQQDTY